jgi:hypothetical protein
MYVGGFAEDDVGNRPLCQPDRNLSRPRPARIFNGEQKEIKGWMHNVVFTVDEI